MTADNDIVERLQSAGHFYAPPHDAILYEAAAEIVRLRGEAESMEQMARMQAARADAAEREVTHLRSIASAEAKGDEVGAVLTEFFAKEMPAGTIIGDPNWWSEKLARHLKFRKLVQAIQEDIPQPAGGEAVACRVIGYLSSQRAVELILDGPVPDWITKAPGVRATLRPSTPAAQVQQADADEDAYVIDRLAHLLAEISIIVNGPEPAGTKWSYHDLPEKVRALKTAPAAVPAGEAVAWLASDGEVFTDKESADRHSKVWGVNPLLTPLYTTPPAPVQAAPQPADGEAGAALYGMFRALVDAGGATTVARHGAMPRPEKLMDALTRGMLAIERMFHPERFELDEFPSTAARPPAPVQAAPQEGGDSHAFKNFHRSLCARFGYTHDENDWRRDLASLEEHIARMAARPSACELGSVREALEAAARSLRTIAEQAGKTESLDDMMNVRGYANSRANVAELALQHRGDSRGGEQ